MTLVLCDVDKTLLTVQGKMGDMKLPDLIEALGSRGYTIGLASNSAVPKLARWYDVLHCNGPVIAERGALLLPTMNSPVIEIDACSAYFQRMRAWFVAALMADVPHTAIVVGDYHLTDASEVIDGVAERIVRVNGTRRASFSCVLRRIADGKAIRDAELLHRHEQMLRELVALDAPTFPLYWDVNEEYGSIIIGNDASTKTHAARHYLAAYAPHDRVIMIGDSMHDLLDIGRAEHWAVANADADYRSRCARVAEQTYAHGVRELLIPLLDIPA